MSSIREQIALKRAEAAKRAAAQKTPPADAEPIADQRSVDDVIRRGQQTGSVNLMARQLTVVPAYLFQCHLGIVPDSMKADSRPVAADSSWYGARDLSVLKLASNEISSVPPEISLFGAITVLDLHDNHLESLPNSISDLSELSTLDVSHNHIQSLPPSFSALPSLTVLNLAHNRISDLGWTAAKPFPRLHTLSLSFNPLGPSNAVFDVLKRLPTLRELRMRSCHLNASSLPSDHPCRFPSLTLLDIEENAFDFSRAQLLLGEDRVALYEGQENRVQVLARGRIVKEKWELEAERRVRRVRSRSSMPDDETVPPSTPPPMPAELTAIAKAASKLALNDTPPESPVIASTSLDKWYDAAHAALNLPACVPMRTRGPSTAKPEGPQQTLPVEVFHQAFASNLRTLTLSNRRVDKTFVLPGVLFNSPSGSESASSNTFLPRVEELFLDGCGLGNQIVLSEEAGPSRMSPIFSVICSLFPSLATLDLSLNQLSSYEGLEPILRRGLRVLRLRGNQFQDVDVFAELAQDLRSGSLSTVRLMELDVRENNINKLNPLLGLLPLTGLYVDGNVFRIPQRRIWEREGTEGLMKWLKDRIG